MINATNFKSGSIKQKSFAQDILEKTYEAALCDLKNYEAREEGERTTRKAIKAIEDNKSVIKNIEALASKKFSAKSVIEAATEKTAMYYQGKCWKIDFDSIK